MFGELGLVLPPNSTLEGEGEGRGGEIGVHPVRVWPSPSGGQPHLVHSVLLHTVLAPETLGVISLGLVLLQLSLVVPTSGTLRGGEEGERREGEGRGGLGHMGETNLCTKSRNGLLNVCVCVQIQKDA